MLTERVGVRVAIGLFAGVLLLGAVHWISDRDRPFRAPSTPAAVPPSAPRSTAELASVEGPGVTLIYLALAASDLPGGVAPVVEVEPGGGLRVHRPPPVAQRPDADAWLAAGVVLPAPELAQLSPVERVGLLDVWAAMAGDGGLRADQIVPVGLRPQPGELANLLRWLR